MSFKYSVQRVSDNCYSLPQIGTMLCNVVAFLDEYLYEISEESLWQQAYQAASYPGVCHVFLMPDTHSGFGVPIGCVVLTKGTILMTASGYDISCGMILAKMEGVCASDVADPEKRRKFIKEVELRVPIGIGMFQPELMKKIDGNEFEEILRYGGQLLNLNRDKCERTHLDVDTSIFDSQRIEKAFKKGNKQLFSLGSGNHFAEVLVNIEDSSVWIMVHTGSRGYGWETANHYFYEAARLRNIPPNRREEAFLYFDEPLGQEYWNHHNSAANFAIVNRHGIVAAIDEASQIVFGGHLKTEYEISHNLIQEEMVVLPDGSQFKGLVHRKGATRAFPAKYPFLFGTKWYESGHPILIPGSMREGCAIMLPADSKKSAYSVNHGSGRVLPRNQAKRDLSALQNDIDEDMKNASIVCKDGTTIKEIIQNNNNTPLDECGMVYKSLDSVLNILIKENVAILGKRLYPIVSIKAKE